ncbi:MAG: hypothetical protein ACREIA_10805 [Opitutaceae bacterium]
MNRSRLSRISARVIYPKSRWEFLARQFCFPNMSAFKPRTFVTRGLLDSIKADLLVRFFAPYREHVLACGYDLPDLDNAPALDFSKLHAALIDPSAPPPPAAMADAMALIDDLANEDGADAIEAALRAENPLFERPAEIENADFAIMVWLEKPDLVEEVNARCFAFENRSFLSFRVTQDTELPPFEKPSAAQLDITAQ